MFDNVLHSDVPAIVDVSPTTWTTIIHGLVLSHEIPAVRYAEAGQNINFARIESIIRYFEDTAITHHRAGRRSRNLLREFANQYFFTVGPEAEVPFHALNGLAQEFGWDQIGIVMENADTDSVDTRNVYSENLR